LLMNPLFLLGLRQAWRRITAIFLLAGLLLAALQLLWPGGQYNVDVLVFALPLNLACACWLWRQRRESAAVQ